MAARELLVSAGLIRFEALVGASMLKFHSSSGSRIRSYRHIGMLSNLY
jgi:hypothetical protein